LWKLAYQAKTYRVGPWSLERWGVTLALATASLLVLQWLIRGQPPTPWWHWLVPAALVAGVVGWSVLRQRAAGDRYVIFAPEPERPAPPAASLDPRHKVQVHATGHFEVEERTGEYADLLGYWRTFASREHTVMAILHRDRFLLVGHPADEALGMWYLFIQPGAVREVTSGRLSFGALQGPALRLRTIRTEPVANGKKPPRTVGEVTYLRFEDESACRRVWADLLAD
jgi:hypothetical protein